MSGLDSRQMVKTYQGEKQHDGVAMTDIADYSNNNMF